jgi:hypothetical protein
MTIVPSAGVTFKKAPTIAMGGETGAGKTESALRLARGYVGPQAKFVVIDTEEKRALYKVKRYQPWDWLDFQPPFTPERCAEVLNQCKGYDAVVWDSGSAEYIDEGGLQDIADKNLERLCKGDMSRADKLTAPAWREPKMRHKSKLMPVIRRFPSLLIVCLRCEPKIKFLKGEDGKTQIVDAGYQPICERMFGYDMLVFAMMHADNPGVPVHLKKLEPDLEPVFAAGQQIDESTGERLAEWASNRSTAPQVSPSSLNALPAEAGFIDDEQAKTIEAELRERKKPMAALLASVSKNYGFKVERLTQIKSTDYNDALMFAKR